MAIKSVAQAGFAASTAYDTHRPSFPPKIVQTLLEHVRVAKTSGKHVLDLAAGTRKFTEQLAARPENYKITAVEPHSDMLRVLSDKKLPHVKVIQGSAEEIPLEDESVDAVIVAQAFHWFATLPVLKEIHRVLVPHGALGLIWNIDDYNSPRSFSPRSGWEKKMHDLIWEFDDDEPRFRHEQWKQAFDEQIKTTPLSLFKASDQYFALPIGEDFEEYEVWLSKEGVWERFATLSQIVVLPEEKKAKLRATIMDALNDNSTETNEKGEVRMHGRTYIAWSTNIPEAGREHVTTIEGETE